MTGKQVVEMLQKAGGVIDRRTRHTILKKQGKTVPVPIHGNKNLPIGTLKSIERITGVKLIMNRLQALYPARIWPEDGVYYVQFLDLNNGFTFGENLTHAKEMATDVLSALLASSLAHHEPIPLPQKAQGEEIYLIAPTAEVQVALLLRFTSTHLPQEQVAKAMAWQTEQNIEPSRTNPTLSQLQKAAHALGQELVIEFRG